MQLELVAKQYKRLNGQGRYVRSLSQSMTALGVEYATRYPRLPGYLRPLDRPLYRFGYDLPEFFSSFPISAQVERESIKHLTTQEMGSLLYFNRSLRNTVITVCDIIPYMNRHSAEQRTYQHVVERLFDRLALMGLTYASAIIAISEYTKQTLVEHLGIAADKIKVVHMGLNHQLFQPTLVSDTLRTKYGLSADYKYLLFVGPETPRKNLHRLVDAFAMLRAHMPNLRLIKVGKPMYEPGYVRLQQQIEKLNLHQDIIFLEQISDQELVELYAMADVYVFPSLYEGFGLPTLEAMACGAPVVCANAASLPEVVGDAALLVDPLHSAAMAEAIASILDNSTLRANLIERGFVHARQFTWEQTARQTLAVYRTLLN
ncbi:MAG: glycosyltransferase family 4 protein [Caldilineaceae bacterium]|nr:glycosyltransferase family 4 protein [Caldilineaceae bacterium]